MHFRLKFDLFDRRWIIHGNSRIPVIRVRPNRIFNTNKEITLACTWADGRAWTIHYARATFKGEITVNGHRFCTCDDRIAKGIVAAEWTWTFTDPASPPLLTRFAMEPFWTLRCTTLDLRVIATTKMGCGWVRTIYRPSFHSLAPLFAFDVIRQSMGDPS
jgi:hypothetical protein